MCSHNSQSVIAVITLHSPCVWDHVSHEDDYMGFFVYRECLGCILWTFRRADGTSVYEKWLTIMQLLNIVMVVVLKFKKFMTRILSCHELTTVLGPVYGIQYARLHGLGSRYRCRHTVVLAVAISRSRLQLWRSRSQLRARGCNLGKGPSTLWRDGNRPL
jgi:hypothetical protein